MFSETLNFECPGITDWSLVVQRDRKQDETFKALSIRGNSNQLHRAPSSKASGLAVVFEATGEALQESAIVESVASNLRSEEKETRAPGQADVCLEQRCSEPPEPAFHAQGPTNVA